MLTVKILLNQQTIKPDIIYINISNELNNKKYDIDKLNEMKKEHPNLVINIVELRSENLNDGNKSCFKELF